MSEVSTVAIRVGGRVLEGFESVTVTSSMDAFATSWSARYHSDIDEDGREVIIEAGDDVEILIDDESVLLGYVDRDDSTVSGSRLKRDLRGRSRLGDAVDCSAYVAGRKRWRNASVFTVIADLLVDYAIELRDESRATDPFERFELRETESISSCALRAAKARGVVLIDEGGTLVIANAGQRGTATVLRETTVLSARRSRDWSQRFSEYAFRTKRRPKNDAAQLSDTSLLRIIRDEAVQRLRRLVTASYGEKDADVEVRAQLEHNVRAGRSETLEYEVPGFRDESGDLWLTNTRVKVVDRYLNADFVGLIIAVEFTASTDQQRTRLTITQPSAYDVVVAVPARRRGEAIR